MTRRFRLFLFSAVAGGFVSLASASCDRATSGDEAGADLAPTTPSQAGGDGSSGGGSGQNPSDGEPPNVDWALDSFHLVTELPADVERFQIDKIRLLPDGTSEQRTIRCGVEDTVSKARWRDAGNGIEIDPAEGETTVTFAGSGFQRLVLRRTEQCAQVNLAGTNPAGVELGEDVLTRGDLCLACGNISTDQLRVCDDAPPSPCQ